MLEKNQENQITKRTISYLVMMEVFDTDDDSDMEDEKKAKPDEEEEDDLIKALKATREKKTNSSPDI